MDGYGYELPMFGDHNVENAIAAIPVARHIGIDPATVGQALKAFKGFGVGWKSLASPVVSR